MDYATEIRELYHYDPSKAAAIIFAVFYGLSLFCHEYQFRNASTQKFAVLLPTAATFSTVGFIARAVNTLHVGDASTAWKISLMTTLGAAPTYAAADYFICGRLFSYVPHAAPISPLRVVKSFIFFDILAEIGIWVGGGLSDNSSDGTRAKVGLNFVRAAIMIQAGLFLVFVCVVAVFHVRAISCGIWRESTKATGGRWTRVLFTLYASSLLILIRSAYHIAESFVPKDHVFKTSEVPFLLLEALMLLLNTYMFNALHPSYLLPHDPGVYLQRNGEEARSERIAKSLYDTRPWKKIIMDPLDLKGLFSKREKEPLVSDPEGMALHGDRRM